MFGSKNTTQEANLLCGTCGKTVSREKARTNVTRYLSFESRCQCIAPEQAGEATATLVEAGPSVDDKHSGTSAESANPSMTAISVSSPLSLLGEQLPDYYELEAVLGEGGMGVVVKARDKRDDRQYAIKMLRPSFLNDAQTIRRFENEAKAAIKLKHPGIVAAQEFGVSAQNVPFLVMDFLEGESLENRLKRKGALAFSEALDIFNEIAEALYYAHENGVIHRDIKPSNIMIVRDASGKDRVKLVDFGIARVLMSGDGTACSLTQTGEIFGSPLYMSPEQCQGQEAQRCSDIYAFGCLMYECIAGRPPFASENPVKLILGHIEEFPKSLTDVLQSHGWYSKLTWRERRKFENLNSIVMRTLEKNPNHRYWSTAEIIADLHECRGVGRRLVFVPIHQLKEHNRRLIFISCLIGIIMLTTIVAGFIGFFTSSNSETWRFLQPEAYDDVDARSNVVLAKTYSGKGLYERAISLLLFAEKITAPDSNTHKEAEDLRKHCESELVKSKAKIESYEFQIKRLANHPQTKLKVMGVYASYLESREIYDRAEEIYKEALAIPDLESKERFALLLKLGHLKEKMTQKSSEFLPIYDQALALLPDPLPQADTNSLYLDFLEEHAKRLQGHGDLKGAEKCFLIALSGAKGATEVSPQEITYDYSRYGLARDYVYLLYSQHRFDEAKGVADKWHIPLPAPPPSVSSPGARKHG